MRFRSNRRCSSTSRRIEHGVYVRSAVCTCCVHLLEAWSKRTSWSKPHSMATTRTTILCAVSRWSLISMSRERPASLCSNPGAFQLSHEPGWLCKNMLSNSMSMCNKDPACKGGCFEWLGSKDLDTMPVDAMLFGFLCVCSHGFCRCNLRGPICWTFSSQFFAGSRRMEPRSQWANSGCIGVKKKIAQRKTYLMPSLLENHRNHHRDGITGSESQAKR